MASPGYIPGPLVIPLTFQIRLLWQLANGRAATNVLHAIVPDGLGNSVELANLIYGTIAADGSTATYFGFLSSLCALQGVDIRDLRTASQGLMESTDVAVPGTGGGNALPEEVALVVTLRSALAGRAHRGRIYLMGFDTATVEPNGHATPALTAAADAWVAAIRTTFEANAISMGIAHRGHAAYVNRLGATVPAEAAGTDRVTGHKVLDAIFDSQRRRK